MTDGAPEPERHELRYIAAASISVCEQCGATFETGDLQP
jgi:hypothetical protein